MRRHIAVNRSAALGFLSNVAFGLPTLVRWGQSLLAASFAAYFSLVAFTNITDYRTNFGFVQHVMCMDTIPVDKSIHWRAICNPAAHHFLYGLIIVWEASAGVLCMAGAIMACKSVRKERDFRVRLSPAVLGLWCGLLLWVFAFLTVGGEWFLMWRSTQWSGETTAFRMAILNGLALVLLTHRASAWRTDWTYDISSAAEKKQEHSQ
jgi:predicted small integral membrane protein